MLNLFRRWWYTGKRDRRRGERRQHREMLDVFRLAYVLQLPDGTARFDVNMRDSVRREDDYVRVFEAETRRIISMMQQNNDAVRARIEAVKREAEKARMN